MTPPEAPPNSLEIVAASPNQEGILSNLLQLYIHDLSEFHEIDLDVNGRYEYRPLELYWIELGRYPFLIKVDGQLAGFALVKRGSEVSGAPTVWDMAEFFLLRKYRRRGLGSQVAQDIWRRFPGQWEVRAMKSNHAAFQFWERTVSDYLGEAAEHSSFEKRGVEWTVFSF